MIHIHRYGIMYRCHSHNIHVDNRIMLPICASQKTYMSTITILMLFLLDQIGLCTTPTNCLEYTVMSCLLLQEKTKRRADCISYSCCSYVYVSLN